MNIFTSRGLGWAAAGDARLSAANCDRRCRTVASYRGRGCWFVVEVVGCRMTNRIKGVLAVVVVVLGLSASVVAGPSEDIYADIKKAAEQGDAAAQYNLGRMYYFDQGDYTEAVKWFRKAAGQGHDQAQAFLGLTYIMGRHVPQDYAEALKWYRKAAEQGNARAQRTLGSMYYLGQGVPQDYVQAHKWYNLAAASFPEAETLSRNLAVYNRDEVASKMTPAQIAEAQKLAREWKPKPEKGAK